MEDSQSEYVLKVTQVEGYSFKIDFGLDGTQPLLGDEDPPLGRNKGPDPSRLLAAAVAQCTLSSLMFCLEKSRAKVTGLSATARIAFARNDKKRLRVSNIDVIVDANVPDSERSKLERCFPIFQDFCTVSQSVKTGIPINITVARKG